MQSRELESLLKNVLSDYKEEHNAFVADVNEKGEGPERKMIDFALTFTNHKFEFPMEEQLKMVDDQEKLTQMKALVGKEVHYMRVVKNILLGMKDGVDKRIIFTAYRWRKDFKQVVDLKKSMLMECIKIMMIGGLEYSEAIYENQKESDGTKVED